MANHKSAEKRIRQTQTRTRRNRYYKARMRSIVRDVRSAIAQNDVEKASAAFLIANRELHKLVSKGILKKMTASRKVSRLNTALKKISVSA